MAGRSKFHVISYDVKYKAVHVFYYSDSQIQHNFSKENSDLNHIREP